MKAYVATHIRSRALLRVANALVLHAPAGVEIVRTREEADLVVHHVVGVDNFDTAPIWTRIGEDVAAGRRYAIIQYCHRTAPADWLQAWAGAEVVWSYLDLGHVPNLYRAPLGVSDALLAEDASPRARDIGVVTSGFVNGSDAEAIEEVAHAAARCGLSVVHVGPWPERMKAVPGKFTTAFDITDGELAAVYRRAKWVSGLRHVEGFELPAAEGAALGARPVMFDREDAHRWFDGVASFVPERSGEALIEALVEVFSSGQPLTRRDQAVARQRFDWGPIAGGFWERAAGRVRSVVRVETPRPRLLWVGDVVAATGFSRCTHAALDVLRHDWDVRVVGINYDGRPHGLPYDVYPAARAFMAEDAFGVRRFGQMVREWRPDAAVLLQDPWNVPAYMEHAADVPVVGWIAVDHQNVRGEGMNGLAGAVFWTQFALDEARKGGYTGPGAVVPLGVDTSVYRPLPKDEARSGRKIGLPPSLADKWLVGMVGRNQERKRLDLALMAFARWIEDLTVPGGRAHEDVALLLHVAPTGDDAFDLPQLVKHLGLSGRVYLLLPELVTGLDDDAMPWIYACMDCYLSTAQGEGWNLPLLEAMACGVPTIAPDFAGPGDWAHGACRLVECATTMFTPWKINARHAVPSPEAISAALTDVMKDRVMAEWLIDKGLERAARPEYRWPAIGKAFAAALRGWAWPYVMEATG